MPQRRVLDTFGIRWNTLIRIELDTPGLFQANKAARRKDVLRKKIVKEKILALLANDPEFTRRDIRILAPSIHHSILIQDKKCFQETVAARRGEASPFLPAARFAQIRCINSRADPGCQQIYSGARLANSSHKKCAAPARWRGR
jgi:hypothetical protein